MHSKTRASLIAASKSVKQSSLNQSPKQIAEVMGLAIHEAFAKGFAQGEISGVKRGYEGCLVDVQSVIGREAVQKLIELVNARDAQSAIITCKLDSGEKIRLTQHQLELLSVDIEKYKDQLEIVTKNVNAECSCLVTEVEEADMRTTVGPHHTPGCPFWSEVLIKEG